MKQQNTSSAKQKAIGWYVYIHYPMSQFPSIYWAPEYNSRGDVYYVSADPYSFVDKGTHKSAPNWGEDTRYSMILRLVFLLGDKTLIERTVRRIFKLNQYDHVSVKTVSA